MQERLRFMAEQSEDHAIEFERDQRVLVEGHEKTLRLAMSQAPKAYQCGPADCM
jgi:hypothetical protein